MIDFLIELGIPKQLAGDVWILAAFVVLSVILVLVIPRKNLGALLISGYVASGIVSFSYFLPRNNSDLKIGYFLLLILAIFSGMKRMMSISLSGQKALVWAKTFLVSFIIVGMIVSFSLSWLPKRELKEFFTPLSLKLLATPEARLFWAVTPFVVLALFKKRRY